MRLGDVSDLGSVTLQAFNRRVLVRGNAVQNLKGLRMTCGCSESVSPGFFIFYNTLSC